MLFRLQIYRIFWFFLILNAQLVIAHPPLVTEDANISEKGDIALEIGNEDRGIGSESGVLIGFQHILYFTSIKANLGYSPSNDLVIDQIFDDSFFYGLEIDFPILREGFILGTEITGEFGISDSEKPLLSRTSLVYELNNQVVIDGGFEIGLNDTESSKTIILSVTFAFE